MNSHFQSSDTTSTSSALSGGPDLHSPIPSSDSGAEPRLAYSDDSPSGKVALGGCLVLRQAAAGHPPSVAPAKVGAHRSAGSAVGKHGAPVGAAALSTRGKQ